MEKLIAQFPKNIADALEIATNATLNSLKTKAFSNVVICGMGGSGIGGKLAAQWFYSSARVPIVVVNDYHVPSFVNSDTLVIASSYSGNTEETLSAVNEAHLKKATIIGVCSGGELLKFCEINRYDVIKVPGGNPPRSMLAFSVIQLVRCLAVAGIIDRNALTQIDQCRGLLNRELVNIKKQAQQIAELAYKKRLVIYAPTVLEAVAVRGRQQINENAKQLCWHHSIPEMNHNELVGWESGHEDYAVLFLSSQYLNDRNKKRFVLNECQLAQKTPHIYKLEAKGKSIIEESFYLIHVLDWASVILAGKNNVDPVEVNVIEDLKKQLVKA